MYATSYPNYMQNYETWKWLLKHILTQLTIQTFHSYSWGIVYVKGFNEIGFHDLVQREKTKQYTSNSFSSIYTYCNKL